MIRKKAELNLKFTYIIISTILMVIFLIIYIQFDSEIKSVKKNFIENEVEKVSEYTKKISNLILKYNMKDGVYNFLKKRESLRSELEDKLRLLKTSKYINIFLIYKDENDKYRYLLDAEDEVDNRGEFDQKFDPESKIWSEVYVSKKAKYVIQDNIDELWVTYLSPIIVNGEINAIIAFDFSTFEYNKLLSTLLPLKKLFFNFILVIFTILIYLYFQAYLSYRTKLKGYKDPLTNSYNRYYLNNLSNKIVLSDYMICMIDIDYFKNINDTFGHYIGDRVLEAFSKRIIHQIKSTDILLRYGGEEFLLFLHKKKNKNLMEIPERIRKLMENNPISIDEQKINITVSIGVNNRPELSKNLDEAIKVADKYLYEAKESGRNRVI